MDMNINGYVNISEKGKEFLKSGKGKNLALEVIKGPKPLFNDIVKDGSDPIGIEYILTYDKPEMGFLKKEPALSKGTICINVSRNIINGHNHGYKFTVKDTNEEFIIMYPWALAENTPENFKHLKTIWEGRENIEHLEKIQKKYWKKLKTL